MATKNLKPSESSSSYDSSSEDDELSSPPSASVVAAATTETKVLSHEEEEDDDNGEQSSDEDESSSEEDKDVMILEQGGDWFSNSVLLSWVVNLGMDEVSVKRLWGCVSAEKKKKMHDRCRVLQAKDVEFASQKSEFVNDVVSLFVEASSAH